MVKSLITGTDGIVRGAKIRTRRFEVARTVQLLYPLELSSEPFYITRKEEFRRQAKKFHPNRRTAELAREAVKQTFDYEDDEQEGEWQIV